MRTEIILFVAATAGLFLVAGPLVFAMGMRRPAEVLVGAGVLTGAQIVGLSLLVGGLFQAYRPAPMAAAVGILAIATLAATLLAPQGRCSMRLGSRLLWASARFGVRRAWRHPVTVVLLCYVAAQYALRVAIGVRLPHHAFDAVSYHLAAPDMWILEGRVTHTTQAIWADVFPMNVETLYAWPGLFLHTMAYVSMAKLPFTLMGAVAVGGIARCLGARRGYPLFAGLLWLAVPAGFTEVSTGYIDETAAALVLTAVYLGIRAFPSGGSSRARLSTMLPRLLLAGMALGLASGAKAPNLLFVPLLAATVWAVTLRLRKAGRLTHRRPADLVAPAMACLLLPTLALGSFWYVRNWLTYANPLHPFAMFGFAGVEPGAITNNYYPPALRDVPFGEYGRTFASWLLDLRPDVDMRYAMYGGGYGSVWVPVLLPLALAGVVIAVRRRRLGAIALTAAMVVPLLISPSPWWTRLNLTVPALGAAFAMLALSRLPRPTYSGAVRVAALCLVLLTGWISFAHVEVGVGPTVRVDAAISLLRDPQRADKVWPSVAYAALDQVPDGSTVATLSGNSLFAHAIIGDELRRRLVMINVTPDAEGLRRSLAAQGAAYVLIGDEPFMRNLLAKVRQDQRHFRRLTGLHESVHGAALFHLGDFQVCESSGGGLARTDVTLAAGSLRVAGTLLNGCGEGMANEPVEVWRGVEGTPVWSTDRPVGTAVTDDGGVFETVLAPPTVPTRYFLRYGGDGVVPASVSSPVTIDPAASR